MIKRILDKLPVVVLVLVTFGVVYYFYNQGEITLFSSKTAPVNQKANIAEFPFTEKELTISYPQAKTSSVNLARFEENENWQGEGEFDYSNYYEGDSSLALVSADYKKASAILRLPAVSLRGVKVFKFMVNLKNEPADVVDFTLKFSDASETTTYEYPLTAMKKGWNLLELPANKFVVSSIGRTSVDSQEEWGNINKIEVSLTSRPKTRSTINLDWLWAEKDLEYKKDWQDGNDSLSLGVASGGSGLLKTNLDGAIAVSRKITSAKNYILTGKFIPLRGGRFGYFLRGDYGTGFGYYLLMDGEESNNWRINRYANINGKVEDSIIARGTVDNFKIEKGKSYWLRAEVKGVNLAFFLSLDGTSYIKLGDVNDNTFRSGGVGVAGMDGVMFLVDDILFAQ